jgi:hypothetical protein
VARISRTNSILAGAAAHNTTGSSISGCSLKVENHKWKLVVTRKRLLPRLQLQGGSNMTL